MPSKLAWVSSCSGSRIGTDEPPGITALSVRPSRTPPARSSISSRSVMFIDASNTPGFFTPPLESPRFFHVAADPVKLGPAVLLRPERRVPFRPLRHDRRHVAQRLDVV